MFVVPQHGAEVGEEACLFGLGVGEEEGFAVCGFMFEMSECVKKRRRRGICMYVRNDLLPYSPIAHRLQDQVFPRAPLRGKEEASRVIKLPHGLATVVIHDMVGAWID